MMSIIAGIYTTEWTPELITMQQKVVSHLSRNPADHRHCFKDSHLFLCQVDYRCYGESARAESEKAAVAVAGHTLLSSSLAEDLHALLAAGDREQLISQAQGTFCVFHYCKQEQQLEIYCDSLSLRPYYLLFYKGAVIFSTCLRLFPHLGIQLDNNLEAITELATLGYTLGDKTQYSQVVAARPGEMLVVSPQGTQRRRYFRWADAETGDCSLQEGINRLDKGFKLAVGRYLGADRHTVSTLSGGLDSRLIATEIRRRGVDLECLNFSRSASQDAHFSRQYADFHQIPLHSIKVTDTQELTVEQRLGVHWQADQFRYYNTVERPRLFWSGNGGSVCVGQIYTSDAVIDACRKGDPELLADSYLEQQMAYIPRRLVRQGTELQQSLRSNLLDSLSEYEHLPLLKAYQLFLWENDQHHHIALPFEEMDRYRLDFCLPFYSKGVLEAMFAMKTEWALRHGVYMKWLETQYPQALQTPWQAYPGHIPCPLEPEEPLADQWHFKLPERTKRDLIKEGMSTVFAANGGVFNRPLLGAQCALTALGLYDCSSGLSMVKRMNKHMV